MINRLIIKKMTSFNDHRGYYWTTWKNFFFNNIYFNHDKFSISKKNYFSQLGKNRNYTVYYNENRSTIEMVKKELDLLLN